MNKTEWKNILFLLMYTIGAVLAINIDNIYIRAIGAVIAGITSVRFIIQTKGDKHE